MVRKKVDERIRTLLEHGIATNTRSMMFLVGDHGKDQVPNLHQILSRITVRARPSVLWCYKKELGFSTHKKKRMKKMKRDKSRGMSSSGENSTDNFELFISNTDINWCYYRDTHRVLGTTVGVLILQDFEALTPNLLARTIETVEGGGLVIFLLRTVKSLKQLYSMSMDVHSRYRTEAGGDVVPRFNERFILSLAKCRNCLVCDDELNILPISSRSLKVLNELEGGDDNSHHKRRLTKEVLTAKQHETSPELMDLKAALKDTPHVGCLINLAKTLDQAKAVLTFLDACSDKNCKSTVALTASRGRGKSAAIGLCLAGAISFGYSIICVTAPEPENLVAVFDFVVRGLTALKYVEHVDYSIQYNDAKGREDVKCVLSVVVLREHYRQTIKYVRPENVDQFASAEIVAIDEAAAIPLPTVRKLMLGGSNRKAGAGHDRLTFMSSTVNGYEGTGRALSLKLLKELRDVRGSMGTGSGRQSAQMEAAMEASTAIVGPSKKKGEVKVHEQRWAAAAEAAANAVSSSSLGSKRLREIELVTPIRYAAHDPIESWLNKLLCLDCSSEENTSKLKGGAPSPTDCELYSVDRDALFSYHKLSETFLQALMGLYTSAHYKNSPNDLQMLSDAPSHAVFVLLPPTAESDGGDALPDILAVVQIALEGRISRKSVQAQLSRGHRSAGDLIPWTISQQFGDSNFAGLSGARIVRVAVHPAVQGMGYGSRAVELLFRYYNGEMMSLANSTVEDMNDEGEEEGRDDDEEDDDSSSGNESANNNSNKSTGIQGERLKPRKQLPPLLLPLTEVKAPRLDWIGTSFGLTGNLHKFWRRAGFRMLYLRQTKNELTGEHSAILVKALPKRTGYDDAWLPAFVADSRRRILSLLGGSFCEMEVRTAISILDDIATSTGDTDISSTNDPGTNKDNEGDQTLATDAKHEINVRSGITSTAISLEELNYFITPHDMKRLELYGRNLCDHHLITDLLSSVARLYFTGRFGPQFQISSLQSALLCGIGLQHKTVGDLADELGLPLNQVLAMFNKSVRKISMALQGIAERDEEAKMMSDDARSKAEKKALRMKIVSQKTLEEDAEEGAKEALVTLNKNSLPPVIMNDPEMSQYIIKGTDDQWKRALKDSTTGNSNGTIKEGLNVQIQGNQDDISSSHIKRKLVQEDIDKEIESNMSNQKGKSSSTKKKRKSSSKKSKK